MLSLLEEHLKNGYTVNAEIAAVHLGLGNREKALEFLGRAAEDEDEVAYLRNANTFLYEPRWTPSARPAFQAAAEKAASRIKRGHAAGAFGHVSGHGGVGPGPGLGWG